MQATVRPLLFWQTSFWAGMHSCYSSGKRMDLVNLSERLALCLVILALLPVESRCNQSARAQAFAREGRRAAKHFAANREPQHLLFQACPASTLPPQLDESTHGADVINSGPAQHSLQGPHVSARNESMGKLGAPPLSAVPSSSEKGNIQAGAAQGTRQETRKKRKAGPAGRGGEACKVPRLSETRVRILMKWCEHIKF
jgi:hypothetical protein